MSLDEKTWFVCRELLLLPFSVFMYTAGCCLAVGMLLLFFAPDDIKAYISEHLDMVAWFAGVVALFWVVVSIASLSKKLGLRRGDDDIPQWGEESDVEGSDSAEAEARRTKAP